MITGLISLIIYLIVIGLVFWLLTYLIDTVPLPEPFNRVAKIALMVVAVLIVIYLLLGLVGEAPRLRL